MNLILNIIVAVSFIVTAVSGIYFMFVSGGRWTSDPMILFNRAAWDQLHTWAGITLIATVIIHFAIHWRWVSNVTIKMKKLLLPSRTALQPVTIKNQ
jgi:cytochrome b subunit of formate dehydrogenase